MLNEQDTSLKILQNGTTYNAYTPVGKQERDEYEESRGRILVFITWLLCYLRLSGLFEITNGSMSYV